MPHGQPLPMTVDRVIFKRHRADVLRALSSAPAGLPHKIIQYDIVKGSVASTILQEFVGLGLVRWEADLYYITGDGRKALAFLDQLRVVGKTSDGGRASEES
jgi:hypothetical protein